MTADRAIYSPRVYLPDGIKAATLFLKDGKIIDLQQQLPKANSLPLDIISDGIVMPGLIDVHAHINEPGRTDWEGFETATRAAAAGGITTLIDMPLNSEPVTTTPNALKQKVDAANKNKSVNLGFWGGLTPQNSSQIESLLRSGVLGLKAFLVHSGIDSFPNATKAELSIAMPLLAKAGLPLLVHCELPVSHANTDKLVANPNAYQAWLDSRPDEMELEAIALIIHLCEKYNCRTHIVHLTTAKALPMIQAAIKKGLPLTVETCPHYLYFNAEDIPDSDCRFKCAPPIRNRKNNEQLLKALCAGQINFVATDHSPAPPALKAIESGNLLEAWGGIASLQLLLSTMWTLLKEQTNGIDLLVDKTITQPLNFLGLNKSKGKIKVGYDADLVVWNPNASFSVQVEQIYFRHPSTSPYIGETLYGVVEKTYVNGELVFDQHQFKTTNAGQLIFNQNK